MIIGYARVSTADQNPELQIDALKAASANRIFTDTYSGTSKDRPELLRMKDTLRPGDKVIVWRLDRLGRSLKDLIGLVQEFEDMGVGFTSITEAMDTTTPGGKLIFHVFGALAEFERSLILERTHAGLAAARARGRIGGRPKKLSENKIRRLRELYMAKEMTIKELCEWAGISRPTLYKYLE